MSKKRFWYPEDFGFVPHRISEHVTREDIFYLEDGRGFQLRKVGENRWMCRRRIKNKKGNTEYLVRFFMKIEIHDYDFAEALLTKGLE